MALPAEQDTHFENSEPIGNPYHLAGREHLAGTEQHSRPVPPPLPRAMPINPVEREKRLHKPLATRASELLDSTTREAEKLYEEARNRASDLVDSTRREAERLYDEARTRTSEGYERLSEKAQEATDQTRHVARYLRNEYPLQLIGILAGAAFVVGMSLRIWRSRA
jgi:ElaB/YqjD/DUF883 family membrane-anchored ribosome-binding protein